MGLVATVSARALIGFRAVLTSFTHRGSSPQRSRSRWRSPVSGCRRTTGADCVGATFHDGARLGGTPVVRKSCRIASAGIVWT